MTFYCADNVRHHKIFDLSSSSSRLPSLKECRLCTQFFGIYFESAIYKSEIYCQCIPETGSNILDIVFSVCFLQSNYSEGNNFFYKKS